MCALSVDLSSSCVIHFRMERNPTTDKTKKKTYAAVDFPQHNFLFKRNLLMGIPDDDDNKEWYWLLEKYLTLQTPSMHMSRLPGLQRVPSWTRAASWTINGLAAVVLRDRQERVHGDLASEWGTQTCNFPFKKKCSNINSEPKEKKENVTRLAARY